jgi:O-succinylbenzoate synthase
LKYEKEIYEAKEHRMIVNMFVAAMKDKQMRMMSMMCFLDIGG